MITLYSTGCPKCEVLKRRLTNDGIEFDISNDVDKLIEMGFMNAPILQIGDNYYEFSDAMKKLKAYEENGRTIE